MKKIILSILIFFISFLTGCTTPKENNSAGNRESVSAGELESRCRKVLAGNRGAVLVFDIENGIPLAVVNPHEAFGRAVRPGSVFKLITAGALLESGKVDPAEKVNCQNFFRLQGRRYICSEPGGHGPVDLTQALARSCSIYFYKTGQRLNKDEIENFACRMGLGRSFPVKGRGDVPISGTCRTPEDPREFLDYLVGDSDGIKITPFQAANIVAVIAAGKSLSPGFQAPLLKESTRRILKQAMERSLVEGTAGELRKRGLEGGAKTGTSANNHLDGKTHGWFCGFYPAENPRYVVVVFLDDGKGYVDAVPMGAEIFALLRDIDLAAGGTK